MNFGSRLRQLRIEKGMSLEQVAMLVGLTRPTVYRYEVGAIKNIPPDMMHKLASLFGVTRPYLMGWTDERGVNPSANLDTVAENLRTTQNGEFIEEDDVKFWRATSVKDADCTTAATQAVRALIKYGIARTPVYPQHIIQHSERASFVTYSSHDELDKFMTHLPAQSVRGTSRLYNIHIFGEHTKQPHYLFIVNRNANIGKLKLALAVELGHIYLGHTTTFRDRERKKQEAECFALHLVFPRPVIQLLYEHGYIFTRDSFSMIFGDCEWCLDFILRSRPVHVNPELNRLLKEQFVPYIDQLDRLGLLKMPAGNDLIDLGNYMQGYED